MIFVWKIIDHTQRSRRRSQSSGDADVFLDSLSLCLDLIIHNKIKRIMIRAIGHIVLAYRLMPIAN